MRPQAFPIRSRSHRYGDARSIRITNRATKIAHPYRRRKPCGMKLDFHTILNVVVAMILYKILDALFLGSIVGKLTGAFEAMT